MPEGDSIYRAAHALKRALAGETVVRFESMLPWSAAGTPVGTAIRDIEARGKHLLVHFDDGRVLRTHMRMSGSWHLYKVGEAWRKPAARARVVLGTRGRVAVCFDAPDVELVRRTPKLNLGPDLLDPDVYPRDIARSWATQPEHPVGVTVMRQHLAAGIGNVYKSETLFVERVNPFARTGDLPAGTLERLAAAAQGLLRDNLRKGPRATRRSLQGSRYWVYGRSGRSCFECGARVRMRRQGLEGRSTYYCPTCQGVSERPSSESRAP